MPNKNCDIVVVRDLLGSLVTCDYDSHVSKLTFPQGEQAGQLGTRWLARQMANATRAYQLTPPPSPAIYYA